MTLDGGQAVFTRRGEATERRSQPEQAHETPAPRSIRISAAAYEEVYDMAPGWDKYMLEQCYLQWAATKDPARNEDSRFLSWVRSYTKGKAAP